MAARRLAWSSEAPKGRALITESFPEARDRDGSGAARPLKKERLILLTVLSTWAREPISGYSFYIGQQSNVALLFRPGVDECPGVSFPERLLTLTVFPYMLRL